MNKNDPTSSAAGKMQGVARRQASKGSISLTRVVPKSTWSKIASKQNFHSGEKGTPRLRTKGKEETAFRSSKDVDSNESEKWLDACIWSVGWTALGRGLQMTPGRPRYGLPSFHLVSSLEERCQKSLCDGSQKLVFPEPQPCLHEFVGASRRHSPRRSYARCKLRSLRQHYEQCSFGADWRVCVAALFPEDAGLEEGNTMILASPSSRGSVAPSAFTFDSRLLEPTIWHADCSMSPQLTRFRHGEMDMSTEMNMSMNMNMTPTN